MSTFNRGGQRNYPFTSSIQSLHWVLDMAFHEDRSRVRTGNADQNLAVVRHMAVNMLKQETTAKVGIKAKRKKAGWDYDYLLKVLST